MVSVSPSEEPMDILCVLLTEKPPATLSAPSPHSRTFLGVFHQLAVNKHQNDGQDTAPVLMMAGDTGIQAALKFKCRVTAWLLLPPPRSHFGRGRSGHRVLCHSPLPQEQWVQTGETVSGDLSPLFGKGSLGQSLRRIHLCGSAALCALRKFAGHRGRCES